MVSLLHDRYVSEKCTACLQVNVLSQASPSSTREVQMKVTADTIYTPAEVSDTSRCSITP
jgi:hypothetical protein